MNKTLVLSAIAEVKQARRDILQYLLSIGSERTMLFQEIVNTIPVIEKFEEAVEQISRSAIKVSGQPEQNKGGKSNG